MQKDLDTVIDLVIGILQLPFRFLWNATVIITVIWLEVIWIGFLFGSVIGVILLLIFMPEGFLIPLGLFGFVVKLWPEKEIRHDQITIVEQ